MTQPQSKPDPERVPLARLAERPPSSAVRRLLDRPEGRRVAGFTSSI
ncbi:hypothetical protein ACKI1J_15005 [Streptomyces scabiei]|nr:hypothetical protein [Streptomyces sp.]